MILVNNFLTAVTLCWGCLLCMSSQGTKYRFNINSSVLVFTYNNAHMFAKEKKENFLVHLTLIRHLGLLENLRLSYW